jgi:hypothetical protein
MADARYTIDLDSRDEFERKMRAFVVLTVTQAIRETCEIARAESVTKEEAIAAFLGIADTVERVTLETVDASPLPVRIDDGRAHDDTPHGPLWDTGDDEP